MEIKVLQEFDEDGYYAGPVYFQVLEGVFPPDSTTDVGLPEDADLNANFYRWKDGVWVAEKKPTTVDELVGVVVSHKSQTKHDQEMREIVQRLGESADGYRIVRGEGEDMTWSIEAIPQEEIEAQAIDQELSEFDSQITSLKARMATAMLQNDQETVASLQAEYKTLMGI